MYHSRTALLLPDSPYFHAAARMIDRALRTAFPALADFALVHIVAGKSLIGISAAHRRPEQARALRELMRIHRVRATDSDSAVAQVIRTRHALVRSEISRDPQPGERVPSRAGLAPGAGRIAALHHRLAPRSALVVPIVVRGRVLGALSLCHAQSGRRHSMSDLAPARRLALQIGYALMITAHTNGVVRLPVPAGHARQALSARTRLAARS